MSDSPDLKSAQRRGVGRQEAILVILISAVSNVCVHPFLQYAPTINLLVGKGLIRYCDVSTSSGAFADEQRVPSVRIRRKRRFY